jgi:HAD superfamily hydrolase (TIGR01509 family)
MTPLAIIFDCDGTLADTMPAHYEAWVATLGRYGVPFAEDRFYQMGGIPTRLVAETLLAEHGWPVPADRIVIEKEACFEQQLHAIRPIEPVVQVARAHRGRLPLAVATGGLRRVATRILQQIDVLDWFDAIVTCDDVTRHKPEPEIFLEAARRLGVEPRRCLAYEDTETGIAAAAGAGMHVVDVRTLYTPRRVTAASPGGPS